MNDEQHKNPPDVMIICDAYESGYGHGYKNDGMKLGYGYFASEEESQAYELGYEKGQVDALKPKALPEGWRWVEQSYQRIFDAISAATSLNGGRGIGVSVRAFWEHLDKNQPEPPKGH